MDAHDHPDVDADPLRFKEAIDAFLQRVPMTSDEYDDLEEAEKQFAFTVANVAQADLVAGVYDALKSAIEDGTPFEDFQAQVGPALADEWGGDDPTRLDTIFRTNVMDAYGDGRYQVMTAPAVKSARPYWRYNGIDGDGRTCEICEPRLNVILPADHPWWQRNYPILHCNCRDIADPLTEEEAQAEGITGSPPDDPAPAPGFGTPPAGAGGGDWQPETADYPDGIGDVLDDRLGQGAG